jgi:chromosome segregation ATPase
MNIKMERERQNNSQHVISLQQQLAKLREEKEFQSSQHDLRINKMKGILTSEHNESLVKLKLTLQRQHELEVENERQCHIDELGHYREHYESKIRELEMTLHKVNDTSKAKISELDGLLEKEKMMSDSEIMKHLMVEKELRMKLEKGEREMEEKRKSIDELKEKLKDCETEIDRERNEMKSSLEHEKHQLQEKLNEAYKEIGSLQSVIEKQVIERTHLIERYYSNRTK